MATVSAGRQMPAQSGGNPNVLITFVALLALVAALCLYIAMRPAGNAQLMAQLPPPAPASEEAVQATGKAAHQNPEGEALLAAVVAKPLDTPKPKPDSAKHAVAASGDDVAEEPADTAKTTPADVTVKPQLSGSVQEYAYTLRAGETLYRVSSRFKNVAADVRSLNSLADDNLQAGQVLKVRVQGVHKVSAGEGLAAIARTYGISLAEVRKANALTSDALQPGQELVIPVK